MQQNREVELDAWRRHFRSQRKPREDWNLWVLCLNILVYTALVAAMLVIKYQHVALRAAQSEAHYATKMRKETSQTLERAMERLHYLERQRYQDKTAGSR